jgi:hypothetical protein
VSAGHPQALLRCKKPGGKHCTKCKSRHYCSKACQLVDWRERGHKEACRQMTVEFHDRLLDELMPEKIKEEPAIIDAPAAEGSTAAPRLVPAVLTQTTAVVKAVAVHGDAPDWRGACAICLDVLPVEVDRQIFYPCCCKRLCADCGGKCRECDTRCPLCRAPLPKSDAEWVRRMRKHVDKGNAEAQLMLGLTFKQGGMGLKQSHKRALHLFQLAAAQESASARTALGLCYENGEGVKIDHKAAAQWYRRAADQGYPLAQHNLGGMFYSGEGVAQSYDTAVKWFRLAAAQGYAGALYNLGVCYQNGDGATGRPRGAAPLQARIGQGARRRRGGRRRARNAPRGTLRLTVIAGHGFDRRDGADRPPKGGTLPVDCLGCRPALVLA